MNGGMAAHLDVQSPKHDIIRSGCFTQPAGITRQMILSLVKFCGKRA